MELQSDYISRKSSKSMSINSLECSTVQEQAPTNQSHEMSWIYGLVNGIDKNEGRGFKEQRETIRKYDRQENAMANMSQKEWNRYRTSQRSDAPKESQNNEFRKRYNYGQQKPNGQYLSLISQMNRGNHRTQTQDKTSKYGMDSAEIIDQQQYRKYPSIADISTSNKGYESVSRYQSRNNRHGGDTYSGNEAVCGAGKIRRKNRSSAADMNNENFQSEDHSQTISRNCSLSLNADLRSNKNLTNTISGNAPIGSGSVNNYQSQGMSHGSGYQRKYRNTQATPKQDIKMDEMAEKLNRVLGNISEKSKQISADSYNHQAISQKLRSETNAHDDTNERMHLHSRQSIPNKYSYSRDNSYADQIRERLSQEKKGKRFWEHTPQRETQQLRDNPQLRETQQLRDNPQLRETQQLRDNPQLRETQQLRDNPQLRETQQLRDNPQLRETQQLRDNPQLRETQQLRDKPPLRNMRENLEMGKISYQRNKCSQNAVQKEKKTLYLHDEHRQSLKKGPEDKQPIRSNQRWSKNYDQIKNSRYTLNSNPSCQHREPTVSAFDDAKTPSYKQTYENMKKSLGQHYNKHLPKEIIIEESSSEFVSSSDYSPKTILASQDYTLKKQLMKIFQQLDRQGEGQLNQHNCEVQAIPCDEVKYLLGSVLTRIRYKGQAMGSQKFMGECLKVMKKEGAVQFKEIMMKVKSKDSKNFELPTCLETNSGKSTHSRKFSEGKGQLANAEGKEPFKIFKTDYDERQSEKRYYVPRTLPIPVWPRNEVESHLVITENNTDSKSANDTKRSSEISEVVKRYEFSNVSPDEQFPPRYESRASLTAKTQLSNLGSTQGLRPQESVYSKYKSLKKYSSGCLESKRSSVDEDHLMSSLKNDKNRQLEDSQQNSNSAQKSKPSASSSRRNFEDLCHNLNDKLQKYLTSIDQKGKSKTQAEPTSYTAYAARASDNVNTMPNLQYRRGVSQSPQPYPLKSPAQFRKMPTLNLQFSELSKHYWNQTS